MDVAKILSEPGFFSGLDGPAIGVLASAATVRDLDRDEVLVRHEEPATSFYLVCDGEISREVPSLRGPPLVMHSLGPGQVLGWAWLIPPRKWVFVGRARQPTRVIQFDGTRILQRCESEPRFGYELMKRFSCLMTDRLTQVRRNMMSTWNPPGFG
jgi:CRP/FNR family cyclic AMP-dependent transcriptional regulator